MNPTFKWDKTQDWFWEGNIQQKIVRYLKTEGFTILATADTASKAQGPDIKAEQSGVVLQVSVKGYPSDKYVSGANEGFKKRTHPAIQARHWFSGALFEALLAKCKDSKLTISLGLPQHQTYINLLRNIGWLRETTQLYCYLVRFDGQIQLLKPSDRI